jgi:hypothetical protein
LSRQIAPALSSFFLLLLAFSSQALTAKTTRNVINGNAPYLTFDGGLTRATNVDELLAITLPNGTRITPSTNTSSATKPIQLQRDNVSSIDIGMAVPTNASSVALNTLIGPPNNYWGDDDGDGQGSGGITATGSLTLSIVDKAGNAVDRRDTLTICNAPYKVTLSSSGGTLSTRYGFPKSRHFSASTAIYYIKPTSPVVCFAKPNLKFGSKGSAANDWHKFNYAGPSNIWNPDKGFLTQSTAPSGYYRNFPTTGAHNLYFDLAIEGVNANQLSWPMVTHSGITATMTPDSSGTSVRVKLMGPNESDAGSKPKLTSPATFELVGRDRSGRAVIKYGFRLKQWFVNRGDNRDTFSNQTFWCNSIGYQVPKVRDLTNAQCIGADSGCQGSVGATPSSSGNHYQRRIDSGFFTEWGKVESYTGARFFSDIYWTSDVTGNLEIPLFVVDALDGFIAHDSLGHYGSALCVSVLRP